MPFGGNDLIDENGDPLRGGGSFGGQFVNPGGGPPPSFFGGGPGGSGFGVGPAYAGGQFSHAPVRRKVMGGYGGPLGGAGVMGNRMASPNIGLPSGWRPGGALPGQPGARYGGGTGLFNPPPAAPSGGADGFWNGVSGLPGDPGGWDIPQWNRFASLVAAGDPRLAGTAWDPNGDPSVVAGIQSGYRADALNREQQALWGAMQDAPNDPGLQGYARTRARAGAMSDAAREAANYRNAARGAAANARYGAFGQLFGANLNHGLATQQGLLNQYQQQAAQPGFWDYAAPIIGAGVGGYLGRPGKMSGR